MIDVYSKLPGVRRQENMRNLAQGHESVAQLGGLSESVRSGWERWPCIRGNAQYG